MRYGFRSVGRECSKRSILANSLSSAIACGASDKPMAIARDEEITEVLNGWDKYAEFAAILLSSIHLD